MSKIFIVLLFSISIVGLNSCCHHNTNPPPRKEIVYSGYRWDIVKISSNIYVVTPGVNARRGDTPVVIDINLPGGIDTINKIMAQ
jgi:hypothetical protein